MLMSSNDRVLCVDDEPNVLEGLKRTLRRSFHVVTAVGPEAGLQTLEREGPFAVIVSDLSMPGMDGVAFFEESRKICPDSMRILLTGDADLNSAMSAINRGAIFRFLLKPCDPDVLQEALAEAVKQFNLVAQERAPVTHSLPGGGAPAAPGREALKKFLVVDGSATIRRMMVNTLERMGYTEVAEARNGADALELFGPLIRCVITDWDMPDMDGLALIRALRARPDGQKVPIVMVTTRSHRADVLAAKNAGVDTYIVKPFNPPVLKEKLDAVLRATR
jgi:CheY-like chemotaxis protein